MGNRFQKAIAGLAVAFLLFSANQGRSDDHVTVNWTYYDLSSTGARNLIDEMRRKGPNGYWAYTSWWVRWSSSCKVTVEVDYTMPRLADRSDHTARQLKIWDRMIAALKAHEMQHGQHGINAGNQISQARCVRPRKIIRFWNQKDKDFDRETDHGLNQGVVLSD